MLATKNITNLYIYAAVSSLRMHKKANLTEIKFDK